jgi:putative membrane protein
MIRSASFLFGLFLVWVALDSPLADYDHHLLTVHMIQHLLLMAVAPPLILLAEPLAAFDGLRQPAFVRRLTVMLPGPALCWTVSTVTLVGWHVPALLTMAMASEVLHAIELSSFLFAGFLFWWPVISTGPRWSTVLYLFLATLPCDALAGFLLFSERVAYPVYHSMPQHFGLSVVEDQQLAAALMWTCVTLIYLVPAAIVSTRLLSVDRYLRRRTFVQ